MYHAHQARPFVVCSQVIFRASQQIRESQGYYLKVQETFETELLIVVNNLW